MVSPDGQTVGNLLDGDHESFAVHLLDVKSGTRTPQSALSPATPTTQTSPGDRTARSWPTPRTTSGSTCGTESPGRLRAGTGSRPLRSRRDRQVQWRQRPASSGNPQGWVYAVDATTLKVVGTPIQVAADVPMRYLAANGDGARALVWTDRKLQLLDLMQGRVLKTVDPGFYAESWAWTPDGKTIVVVGSIPSQDGYGTVAFLDPGDLSTKSRETRATHSLGGGDPVLARWRAVRDLRARPSGPLERGAGASAGLGRRRGRSLAGFAHGTSEVLIASLDGEVSVWDPRPETAVKAACRIAGRDLTEWEWDTYLPQRERQKICGS